MAKIQWKPCTLLYPVPSVMVTCRNKDGKDNIITVAWVGTVCSNPPMLYISVRPERYSYNIIKETGEFCVNLTTKRTARATDFCGVKSGRDVDKFKEMKLTKGEAKNINAAIIEECPVNIECKVNNVIELGSHHMFIADVVGINVEEKLIDEKGKLRLEDADMITYSHGKYYTLDKELGFFGYSIAKKKNIRRR